jgi:alanyl-tRNA synthetase
VVASVSPSLLPKIKAGDLVKAATSVLGGGGGGRPELAQGKGKDPAKVGAAAAAAEDLLRQTGLRA